MKYAGLMKPPPQMTRDIYHHVISQVALLLIEECNKYISDSPSSVDPMEKKIKDMISDFRSSLDTKGTRDLFKEYKELHDKLRHFGNTPVLKQRDFSGINSVAVRESVKERLEPILDLGYERVHNNYNFGNVRSTKWVGIKEELKGLVLSPRKEEKKWFSVDLHEDWYIGAEKLEEHQERVKQDLVEAISEKEQEIVEYENEGWPTRRHHKFINKLKGKLDDFDQSLEAFKGIFVVVGGRTRGDGKPAGSWETGRRELSVYVKVPANGEDFPIVEKLQKQIWQIVVHEMTHVAQSLLTEAVSNKLMIMNFVEDPFGKPSKKIRTPDRDQHREFGGLVNENHQLDDIEFYTNLRDAIGDIMERLSTYPSENKVIYFKALTAQKQSEVMIPANLFFETLKIQAPLKWKKAVGEAYKLVFNSFAHQRMAQRIARVHLERKKWIEAPSKQFDQDQQEQLWVIYDLSYSKVGKHISSKSDLMRNYDLFWVVDVEGDDEIDAFVSYSTTSFGKKIGLIGSDGTSEGRNAMLMKGAELLLKRGWYAEVDARFARLLKKRLGVNHVQDEKQVRTIINKPLEWDDDKKCYTRNLEGKGEVVKYLVGLPNI
jgi:uncharacterized protein YaaR (DUF327 family)